MINDSVCEGIIIKGIGGFYYVKSEDNVIECHARGKLRKTELTPIVGDYVSLSMNEDGTGSICKIHERRNFLIRPGVANVDALILVSAAKSPLPDYFLTDKLLVTAESKGIRAYICLNKTDLADDEEIAEFASVYNRAGYKVIITSAAQGIGIDELESVIRGKTVAFAGLSGVGKSSLLKILTGTHLETGSVSRIERGRHTTRHVELMEASGGFVFDTPGFSRLEADDIRASELWQYFPEIAKYSENCRFDDCRHIAEPGCSVLEALAEERIAQSRHESYKTLFSKLKEVKDWERK